MNVSVVAHEEFMNGSGTIPPRVGVGVGGRGEEACISAYGREPRPVDNADLAPLAPATDAWALCARIGGLR